ncbi:MAG TPA: RsmD family RNA methyltransferase [Candidatus Saccharimonadia bacterium]|nr:RsmD family RNA methyltransferase [Candidatus Saccharimonadia bacterium]
MRVISGKLGGRNFLSPKTHRTHPMSDKIRGALFNALGDLSGLVVLDAFAGSGACSIEAVSRGAREVLAIDIDPEAVKTVAENVRSLGLEDVITVRRKNISGWSRNNQTMQFDVVLADPPYNDIRPDVLERLAVHIRPGGLFVLSWPGSEAVREFAGLEVISHKTYGDAQLVFYKHKRTRLGKA